jgi:hypothetical protein
MTQRNLQQFLARDDDFCEIGDPQIFDLTDVEIGALDASEGERVLLEQLNGFFLPIEGDQSEAR